MINTYCVDLGVSQHWAGFRLFLEERQVFGSTLGATAQRPRLPLLGFKGPFNQKSPWEGDSRVKQEGGSTLSQANLRLKNSLSKKPLSGIQSTILL